MALVEFIIKAKLSGYAAGREVRKRKFKDGSLGFEFKSEGYRYLDRYYGFNPFSGTEHVYDAGGILIWKMNYYGKILETHSNSGRIYGFLREAMSLVTPAFPFRGPAILEKEDFLYENRQNGSPESFHGVESIYEGGKRVYVLYYHGGKMIRD